MLPAFVIASLMSAPAPAIEPCAIKTGQLRVGITIGMAGSVTGRPAQALRRKAPPAAKGASTLFVHL